MIPWRLGIVLGVAQCINWGALFYAFGILLRPIEFEIGAPRWLVGGAFSAGLVIAGVTAPAIGRFVDRGMGLSVLSAGGAAAAGLLAALSFVASVPALYACWTGLGPCLAATLYEPAFGVIAHHLPAGRPRRSAIAAVTTIGGLASAVFFPLVTFLTAAAGWRNTVRCLAVLVLIAAVLTRSVSTAAPGLAHDRPASEMQGDLAPGGREHGGRIAVLFCAGTFVSAGTATLLVPALTGAGLSLAAAGAMGGFYGLMLLPGRMMLPWVLVPARSLTAAALMMQALGGLLFGLAPGAIVMAAALGLVAVAAGAQVSLRPQVIHDAHGVAQVGRINGEVARAQHFARALAPLAVTALSSLTGDRHAIAVLGGALAIVTVGTLAWSRS
jgi:hypothetical protein